MTFRRGPLRAAAALAAGFVAVRVVYRVLFHGADGAGAVLLPLPALRLPPPVAHVVLFGPVTIDGLADAAASALPIAAVILLFGVLNSLVDMPRVLARGGRRGPLRGVARTLAVAWATLPALADAVRAVRFAQRLRGDRGGARLLAPVLERTLARATALAAALELRGLGGRALDGECLTPVEVRDAELRHRDATASAVLIDELVLAPGSLALVAGATGTGKSTLLRTLTGLHQHLDGGTAIGTVRVVGHERAAAPPRDTARLVGAVLQNPRDGFATARVRDELGLALELRGVAPTIVAARVDEIAERIGITSLLGREVRGLSAGEATLVAIGAAIAEHPILLVVDEPLADLDASARARIVELLDRLAHEAGVCVVVAEHRVDEFVDVADRRFEMAGGVLRETDAPAGRGLGPAPRADATSDRAGLPAAVDDGAAGPARPDPDPPGPPQTAIARLRRAAQAAPTCDPTLALCVVGLSVRRGTHLAVDDVDLAVAGGEIVALVGPNGAGKSSLLGAVALPAEVGTVAVHGEPLIASRRNDTTRPVALVPDASDDLFVCATVAAECGLADRRARVSRGTTLARWAELLGLAPGSRALSERLARHPLDLSVGERRCLALAVQLARTPRVILVDEPTRGLDAAARALVAAALVRLAAEGVAVVLATHDEQLSAGVAHHIVRMQGGRLTSGGLARSAPPQAWSTAGGVEPGSAPAVVQEDLRDAPRGQRHPANLPEFAHATPAASHPWAPRTRASTATVTLVALIAANLVALAAFAWPLVASAVPAQAQAAVPTASLALVPVALLVVLGALDGTVRSAHTLALLGTLAAIGAAIRIVGTGVGGVEAVFILLILAGRAFGARFGMLLGLVTIALSSVVWGGIGPWTPFQMFACAWVGLGAGMLPRRVAGAAEIVMLAVYGTVASFAFGLIMNLWFWPFAVGSATDISYVAGAPLGQNLGSFLLYSLVTSTASWDLLRAITTVVGLALVGRAVLSSLRRAKPVTPAPRRAAARASRAARELTPAR